MVLSLFRRCLHITGNQAHAPNGKDRMGEWKDKTHKNPQKESSFFLWIYIVNNCFLDILRARRNYLIYVCPVCVFNRKSDTCKFLAHFFSSFPKVFPHRIAVPTFDGVNFTSACSENETQAVSLFDMWIFAFIVHRKVNKNK